MADGKLTQAWTRVEASLPLGWRMMGLALGPREVDPVIRGESWMAWAKGPDGERAEGVGSFPVQALNTLADKLGTLRGDLNG